MTALSTDAIASFYHSLFSILRTYQKTDLCSPLTALAVKDIDYEYKAVHLVKDGGEQVIILLYGY